MDHGLETHVDLAAANDLSDIGRVVGLKQSNLEALFIEETLGLSQIQGGVVRRSVPLVHLAIVLLLSDVTICNCMSLSYQLVRKVILSVDILTITIHAEIQLQMVWWTSQHNKTKISLPTPLKEDRKGSRDNQATHVLSLVLSRSSYDSIISERLVSCSPMLRCIWLRGPSIVVRTDTRTNQSVEA